MKKLSMTVSFLLFAVFFQTQAFAQLTIVAVGKANVEQDKVFIADAIVNGGDKKAAQNIVDVMRNDFGFYKKSFHVEKGKGSLSPNWSDWQTQGYAFAMQLVVEQSAMSLKVYKVSDRAEIANDVAVAGSSNIRTQAHLFSQTAYKAITGKDSIFQSKILFVSDRDGNNSDQVKELYIMDFDGHNKKRLTNHRGTVISPEISHDGKQVLYSLIDGGKKVRNVNLFVMDIETGQSRLLSNKKGINSGAIFMPDNEHIALTLSHTGSADIYVMNLQTKALRRLTKHYAPDVDPSINKDGTLMTFLSGRTGAAMIYTMDPNGVEKDVKRISYVGQYNATPRFSPDGKEIAFSSWLDNRFDIFRIGSDGLNLSRLTKDFGSNEDPTYSPDGQFIAFSSQRVLSRTSAVQNIYIMDRDGEILGSITENYGNCITPRWSKL